MQIINYKPNVSGKAESLQGSFDLLVESLGKFPDVVIRGLTYFSKSDGNRWVSMPSRQYEKDGKQKFWPYVSFQDQAVMKRLAEDILVLLDEMLGIPAENKNEPAPDLPF